MGNAGLKLTKQVSQTIGLIIGWAIWPGIILVALFLSANQPFWLWVAIALIVGFYASAAQVHIKKIWGKDAT